MARMLRISKISWIAQAVERVKSFVVLCGMHRFRTNMTPLNNENSTEHKQSEKPPHSQNERERSEIDPFNVMGMWMPRVM
jgi:hypothetical protein